MTNTTIRTLGEELLERLGVIETKLDVVKENRDDIKVLQGRVNALETWRNTIVGAFILAGTWLAWMFPKH